MAITDFDELKTSIKNWINDSTLADDRLNEMVSAAEDFIATKLDVKHMEARATASLTGEYLDLPSDFVRMINLEIDGTEKEPLRYLTPEQMDIKYPSETTGTPKVYTIIGTQLQIKPVTDATRTVEIAYVKDRLAALTSSNSDNWLITNYPSIYRDSGLMQAAIYKKNLESVSFYGGLASNLINELNIKDKQGRYGEGKLYSKPRKVPE